MLRYLIISIFLSFFLVPQIFSQDEKPDTASVLRSFRLNPNTLKADTATYDTTFRTIHFYNPIYYKSFSNTFLGNSGQAAQTNNIDKRNHTHPFAFIIPYEFYTYDPFNILHFNTRKPYTEIKYLSSGSREDSEQVLSALHTQNVNQNLNVGILYDLIASKGIYNNQNTGVNRLNLFGSYKTPNYSVYGSFHHNGFKYEENGGLLDLESFLNRESDALNYTMNLDDANSRLKKVNFFVTQNLKLPVLFEDSARKERFERFSLQHTIQLNRYSRTYRDNIPETDTLNFYQNNYYLIPDISDSSFHQNLSNRIDLNIQLGKKQSFKAYIQHNFKTFSYIKPLPVSYETDSSVVDTVIRDYPKENFNDIAAGGIYYGQLKNWDYSASGEFYFTGYRAGDLRLKAFFTRFLKNRSYFITVGGELSSLKPSYFLNDYGSAHFTWNNDFNNRDHTRAYIDLGKKDNFRVNLALNFFKDYIYLNTDGLPSQNKQELLTATLKIYKSFSWGPVHHIHEVLLQQANDNYINVPLIAYGNSTWYQNALFKKVLKFRVGFDLYYFSEYYADAYSPATGMFYIQKNMKIGNYPYLNAFLDFKLKRTRFTIQYTNALSELMPEANYFMAYRHPNFSGSLKFGIAWTFYD